jgi:hypothetical protein
LHGRGLHGARLVCRRGGRAAFSAWRPDATFRSITQKYAPPQEPGQGDVDDWSREDYAEELLGEWFELAFEDGDAPLVSGSGEEAWQLLVASAGTFKARAEGLEPERRDELHAEFVDFLELHRVNGGVRVPGPYVLVIGRRR